MIDRYFFIFFLIALCFAIPVWVFFQQRAEAADCERDGRHVYLYTEHRCLKGSVEP